MDVPTFIKTLYFGDEGIERIIIDGSREEIAIQVSGVARNRGERSTTEQDEFVENGLLVFEGAKSILLTPPGVIPSDFVDDITAEAIPNSNDHVVVVSTATVVMVDGQFRSEKCLITIVAARVGLEDPKKPGERIYS